MTLKITVTLRLKFERRNRERLLFGVVSAKHLYSEASDSRGHSHCVPTSEFPQNDGENEQ